MPGRGSRIIGIITVGFALIFSGQALAVFGLGIQGGIDQISIAEANASITLQDMTLASYSRQAMEKPYMVGGFLFIDAIPVIDIEVAAEAALQKYQVDYSSVGGVNYSEEVPWGRVSLYLTARKDIIKQPPIASIFALYVGAGVGLHYLAPMINQDFIYDNLETASEEPSPPEVSELLEEQMKRGFHGLAGIRIKPPVFPFGIKVEGRYTLLGKGDYEEPDKFFSIYGGVYTGF